MGCSYMLECFIFFRHVVKMMRKVLKMMLKVKIMLPCFNLIIHKERKTVLHYAIMDLI